MCPYVCAHGMPAASLAFPVHDTPRGGMNEPRMAWGPDALQAASCLQLGADHLLLTGDAAFQRVHGLNVLVIG